MKRVLVFLLSVAMVFGVAGAANAGPVSYLDYIDFVPDIFMKASGDGGLIQYTWQFDITDLPGDDFDPVSQDVLSAEVKLGLWDDGESNSEKAQLTVGQDAFAEWTVVPGEVAFTLSSLATLSDTGIVSATLTATKGDFGVNWAWLDVEATEPPEDPEPAAHTPEPATMLLLGAGLVGMAAVSRMKSVRNRCSINAFGHKA